MAKLTAIPTHVVEAVRDKIGAILLDELTTHNITTNIFVEMNNSFDVTELPAVSVQFKDLTPVILSIVDRHYEASFNVDIFTANSYTDTKTGAQNTAESLARIATAVLYILESPEYYKLDWATDGVIGSVECSSLRNMELRENSDTDSVYFGRIDVKVLLSDNISQIAVSDLETLYSEFRINGTERGLQLILPEN